jgi:AcrR family transcriptional regulator
MRDAVPGRDVRSAILDATDLLLSKYGYKKMTIDDLAAEAGIGKGSVYLHFSSKEEIVLSHVDRIIERLKSKLADLAASERPAVERLHAMLLVRVLHRFDSVQHYTQSLNDLLAGVRPALLERRKRYFEEESRIIERVVAAGQQAGEIKPGDPLEFARTLLLATNSLLPFSLTTKDLGERPEIAKKVSDLADVLLHGIVVHGR